MGTPTTDTSATSGGASNASFDWTDPRLLASLIQLGGGLIQGVGQNKQTAADREAQQRQAIANLLLGQEQLDRNDVIAQGQQELQGAQAEANALGGPFSISDQLQKLRTKRDMLSSVSNISVQAPPDIAPYVGKVSGGFQIPAGGLDTSALSEDALRENARAYLTTLAQLNPNGTTPNLDALSLTGSGSPAPTASINANTPRDSTGRALGNGGVIDLSRGGLPTSSDGGIVGDKLASNLASTVSAPLRIDPVDAARQGYKAQMDARNQQLADINASREQQIMGYLTGQTPVTPPQSDQKSSSSGGGFWHALGKIASVAAPIIAAPFTGGASLALIGAGAGAANAALSGGGLKGALEGGALGAIPGVAGKVPGLGALGATSANVARGAGESAASALERSVLNPAALTKLSGAAIGGPVGGIAQLVGNFLPGASPFRVPRTTIVAPTTPGTPSFANLGSMRTAFTPDQLIQAYMNGSLR